MGETLFQKTLFTIFMATGMVLGMSIYNIILINGLNADLFALLYREIWLVLTIALTLDIIVAGPLAKTFVFRILKLQNRKNKILLILGISLSMVTVMVLLMSIFGSIMVYGLTPDAFHFYPGIVRQNFIAALPLNLVLVSPVARFLHARIFPPVTMSVI